MGSRGPARQPDVIAKIKGNPSNAALDRVKAPGKPVKPTVLSRRASRLWDRIVKATPDELIASVDSGALAAYVEAQAEFEDMVKWCAENPHDLVVHSEKGGVYQHPNVGRKNKAAERMLKFAAQFGFTPSARASIGAELGKGRRSGRPTLGSFRGSKTG